jgi:streptogramin lyase
VIPAGYRPFDVAIGTDAVWVVSSEGGTIQRIDPQTNRVVATIRPAAAPVAVAAAEDAVWVLSGA